MPETSVAGRIRAYAEERRFRSATVDRWLAAPVADAAALLELALRLRLGENQLRDLWDWLDEVACRDRQPLAAVLARPVLQDALAPSLGRTDQLKAFKASLRRLRFPALAAQEERLAGLVGALQLPPAVRVRWPEFLEGDRLEISVEATSPEALRSAAEALAAAARRAECAAIFALLDGGGA